MSPVTDGPETDAAGRPRPGRTRGLVAQSTLAVTLAVALAYTVSGYVPLWKGVSLLALMAWLALPGVWVARRLYGRTPRGRAMAWLVGPAWGYLTSVPTLLVLWELGFQHPVGFAIAPVGGLAVGWVLGKVRLTPAPASAPLPRWHAWDQANAADAGATWRLPRFTYRDRLALAALCLVVPLVVARPFANVARDLPEGRAYRAYFTADFVWAMAVVAEVSKGDEPPLNPFHVGGHLNYYWLAHFLSAAEYRALGTILTKEQIILTNSIGTGLLFLGFFYALGRQAVGSAAAVATGCAAAFLCNSYEGLDEVWHLWREGMPLSLVRYVNIDAISRWVYQGMPVDGLQRMLLYQPHHLMGYAAGASALLLLSQARRAGHPWVALVVGMWLGLSLLFSSFIAILFGLAVAVYYAVRLVAERAWRAALPCAVVGAIPVALAVLAARALDYVHTPGGPMLRLGLNPTATRHWPYVLVLNFGPLLFVGMLGAVLALSRRERALLPAAALSTAALSFYFLVDVPDMQGVWVGWRAGHLMLIALAVFTAWAIDALWRRGRAGRLAVAGLVVPLLLSGAPTVAIDIYNASDITNRDRGPSFPWTLVLSNEELDALGWIRREVPPGAIVQVEPFVRDTATWAYIPAFAERRSAAGLPISMVPYEMYQRASERVRAGIYQAAAPEVAYEAAHRMLIDYILVGPPERSAYPAIEAVLDSAPLLFTRAFRNGEVTIYEVIPQRRQ